MEDDGETLTATVEGESLGLLIGHHGQTIDAVQHLATRTSCCATAATRTAAGSSSTPTAIARAAARRSSTRPTTPPTRRCGPASEVELDPMSPAERRIVHEHLRDREDVETQSEGEGPERRLVVSPAE